MVKFNRWVPRILGTAYLGLALHLCGWIDMVHPPPPQEVSTNAVPATSLINSKSIRDVNPTNVNYSVAPLSMADLEQRTAEEIIEMISTPGQARQVMCLYALRNGSDSEWYGEYKANFRDIHQYHEPMDCTEGTEVVATVLQDNNYPQLMMMMYPPGTVVGFVMGIKQGWAKVCVKNAGGSRTWFPRREGHQVFIYREAGLFHYLDINDCWNDRSNQGFRTIEEVVKDISTRVNIYFPTFLVYDRSNLTDQQHNNGQTREAIASAVARERCYPAR